MLHRRSPTPPTNVRVVHPDGRETPIQLVYVGRHDGLHVWRSVDCPPLTWPTRVACDVLPPKTQLDIVGAVGEQQ